MTSVGSVFAVKNCSREKEIQHFFFHTMKGINIKEFILYDCQWDDLKTAPLQPQPESGGSSRAVEDILLCPVPQTFHPSALSDYRPVALTSHVMKVLVRLLLSHLSKQVRAFRTHYSLLIILGLVLKMPPSTCFSEPTVFWTKQAALWGSCSLISPENTAGCLHNHLDYWLTDKQSTVCETKGLWSAAHEHHTTLHSVHLRLTEPILGWLCSRWMISDGQEAENRELVDHFVGWCGNNPLILNTNTTKEMTENKPNTVSILGDEVEEEHRHLGVHLDSRLGRKCNTEAVFRT